MDLTLVPLLGLAAAVYVPARIARGNVVAVAARDDREALAAARSVTWHTTSTGGAAVIVVSSATVPLLDVVVYGHRDGGAVRGWRRRVLAAGEEWTAGPVDADRGAAWWDLWWSDPAGYRWLLRLDAAGGWRLSLITRPEGVQPRYTARAWSRLRGAVWPAQVRDELVLADGPETPRCAYVPAAPLVSRAAGRPRCDDHQHDGDAGPSDAAGTGTAADRARLGA